MTSPTLGTIASGVGTSLTALNGENIQDDTIDDDSLDFTDITFEDFSGAATATGAPGVIIGNGATSAGMLQINEDTDAGSNNATFTVPALSSDTDYTLPPNDGDSGQQLTTNGTGTLTWESAGGGGFDATAVDAVTWSDGANASNVWTFDVSGTDTTVTWGSALATFSAAVTAVGTISTPTLTMTGTGTINALDAVDSTSENTIEALIFDNDAESITGIWEVQDDVDFRIGNDADWNIQYDEAVDNQLLFVTANTSAIATTDPMFEILVGTTHTANQEVFGVAKGSQSSNTPLMTLDEDGDAVFAGTVTFTTSDQLTGFIETPSEKTYRLIVDSQIAMTIIETTTDAASGTCTATFNINGTPLGGTANSVSSTEQAQAQASANAVVVGDDVNMVISSNSSCADVVFKVGYTRTTGQ
jgi:hypothetical protein